MSTEVLTDEGGSSSQVWAHQWPYVKESICTITEWLCTVETTFLTVPIATEVSVTSTYTVFMHFLCVIVWIDKVCVVVASTDLTSDDHPTLSHMFRIITVRTFHLKWKCIRGFQCYSLTVYCIHAFDNRRVIFHFIWVSCSGCNVFLIWDTKQKSTIACCECYN